MSTKCSTCDGVGSWPCDICGGDGKCLICSGVGKHVQTVSSPRGQPHKIETSCAICRGSGFCGYCSGSMRIKCLTCYGRGFLS